MNEKEIQLSFEWLCRQSGENYQAALWAKENSGMSSSELVSKEQWKPIRQWMYWVNNARKWEKVFNG